MSGRSLGFFAVGFMVWLGVSWACGADETSTDQAQPKSDRVLKLEILSRPSAPQKGEKTSPEAAIRRALDARVRVDFVEASLKDVCGAIGKQLGIPVVLDRRALDDEGLDPETPVWRSMNDVRLRSFLEPMLSDLDLTWTIRHEVLLITTTVAAQEMLETRVYDVTDLAAVPEYGDTDFDTLVELITTIISPNSWSEVGGEDSLPTIEGNGIRAIVISQTFQIHNEIEKLLADLRAHLPKKAAEKDKDAGGEKSKATSEEEAIRQALRKKVDLNFIETSLTEVVDHLKELLQIEIQLHKRSLEDEGLDPETPISFRISGISAAAAMDLMFRDLDLTYTIKDNCLLILTEYAEGELPRSVKIYDVADLVDDHDGFDDLIDAITSAISPDSWSEIGGEGSIVSFANAGMRVLVVSQTQRIQGDIEKLLTDLRKIQRKVDDSHVSPRGMGPNSGMQGMGGFRSRRGRPGLAARPLGRPGRRLARHRRREPLPVKYDPDRDTLVEGNNQFAFDLYDKLREGKSGKNLFFSPMSISTAIAMIHAGARGKTAEEIACTMHFTLPPSRLHPTCRSLQAILQDGSTCELKIANRLWAQRGQVLLDNYLKITSKHYGAKCGLVDFASNRGAAAREINIWVERQTRGRIRDLVGPDTLNGSTLVLTNAVYFKGQWSQPFEVRNTKPAPFFAEDGEKQVMMMSIKDDSCRYVKIEDAGLQILEKPYGSSFDLSMMILLPKRETGSLARLEASLTEEKLAAWSKDLHHQTVKVYLPKLRLETGYSLEKQLTELGMVSAFSQGPNGADFSGMDGTGGLFLQFVIHKTFIDVDEQGTEAAAATLGGFGGGGIWPLEPLEFRADHPFVFLIRDNRTGSILFLGRLCCPESNVPPSTMQHGGGMF